MELFKNNIRCILLNQSSINWLIVHDIYKSSPNFENIKFSCVDGVERVDDPFKVNQGYISFKTLSSIAEFKKILTQILQEFKSNLNVIANLYIIATRITFADENEEISIEIFRQNLGINVCVDIFNLLIDSLNSQYYNHISNPPPENINEWLNLFKSTQYLNNISEPVISCLQLIENNNSRKIDFQIIENMKPLLRAVLIYWHNFDLTITRRKIKLLYGNEKELIFISATLIHGFTLNKNSPSWLSRAFIEASILEYWNSIGKIVFIRVFGLGCKNKNSSNICKKLERLIHGVLYKQLTSEEDKIREWINNLEFKDDFIALFSWFSTKKINYGNIPFQNRALLLNQFVRELQNIIKRIPIYLSSESYIDPFYSFQLCEPEYQQALAHLLILILDATDTNKKDITEICYQIKPLFFGGHRACSIAKNFTQLLLLIGLSGKNLTGLTEKNFGSIKSYLKIIVDTVLISYIHLVEREEEVWNPESEKILSQFNSGQHLIMTILSDIHSKNVKIHYEEIFKTIDEVRVANWFR